MTRHCLCGAAVLALVFTAAEKAGAKTVVVNCDAGKTISWGLSQLATAGPGVLKVNGTCRENVSISGFHNLEVVAANGAGLWPAPSGPGISWASTYVMEVIGSGSVTIKGLTVHAAGALMGMRELLYISAGAIVIIIVLSAVISIYKVMRLEPAIVFKG